MSDGYGEEKEFYESGDESDSGSDGTYVIDDSDDEPAPVLPKFDGPTTTIMDWEALVKRHDTVVKELSDVLCIPEDECIILLRAYRWNPESIKAKWFEDSAAVRERVGMIADFSSTPMDVPEDCLVCYDELEPGSCSSLPCGHYFCNNCWKNNFQTNVSSSPAESLALRCMSDECSEAVRDSFLRKFLSPDKLKRWNTFRIRSFVENNANVSWCPNSSCERVVEVTGGGTQDINCTCGTKFCCSCSSEAHRPASCDDVKNWEAKNTEEGGNVQWMLVNTKPCPKCRTPIEKNQGCNHMRCRSPGCQHEFCWMCLGDWKKHGSGTGGYYKCNRYDAGVIEDDGYKKGASEREKAAKSLERFMFFFERYRNHNNAGDHGRRTLGNVLEKMILLQDIKGLDASRVRFLQDAAEHVIESRRVLKWTYVFAYFLKEGPERALFLYLQERLEENVEHLHMLIENNPIDKYLREDTFKEGHETFLLYREQVINYLAATRTFLTNLLEGVEAGLTDGAPMETADTKRPRTD